MTGRELIMFILVNNLEDTKLSLNDFVLSTVEAAQKFNVGLATIRTWVLEEKINSVVIGDEVYILKDAKPII